MRKSSIIAIQLLVFINIACAQSTTVLDSLFSETCNVNDSREITFSQPAKRIIALGNEILPALAARFTDTTKSQIKSECQNIYLNKGEVAIILADRIELMPYAKLTGMQNCIMAFCKDNANLIEYYLLAIRRNNMNTFQQRYKAWIDSKERESWPPYLNNKKLMD